MYSDFRFAFRALGKTPGFTAAAVLILALVIGANSSVFSVVEAVLFRPLPFPRAKELVSVRSALTNQFGQFNVLEYRAYRDQTRAFAGLAAVAAFNSNLVDRGEAQIVQGLRLSANSFDLLGVLPAAGRLLRPDDDRAEAQKVAVLGYSFWQRVYGGRQDVIGRAIMIDGVARTVVGVLPADFLLPVNGYSNDVCVPLQVDSDPRIDQPAALHFLKVIGRLAPGISRERAISDADLTLADLRRRYPLDFPGTTGTQITSLTDDIVGDTRPVLVTLLGVVASLLLLASVNLAGLMLVRGLGRQRELAIRSALGSSKSQLVRLLFAECAILAVIGGILGLILAQWSLSALVSLIPAGVPRAHDIQFNGMVLGFTALMTMLASVVPGMAPLWLCSWIDLREAVNSGGRGNTGGGSQVRLRHVLASIQIALAVALLACTGLFLRSFWALDAQRPGTNPEQILTARLTLPQVSYPDAQSLVRFYEKLRDLLKPATFVSEVGTTSLLPLANGLATVEFAVAGRPVAHGAELPSANYRLVTPGYLEAMGKSLQEGRLIQETDDDKHPLVVVISRALADAYFPGDDAVGNSLKINDTADGFRTAQIVGIVGNVKQQKLEDAPSADLYVPFRQMDAIAVPWMRLRTFWVIRATGPVQYVETALRESVRAIDASVPIATVATMAQVADSAMAVRKFNLIVIGFLAGSALLLTVAGVYATIAYGVARRTREMGVRLALGATGAELFKLVVGEGLMLVALGSLLGVALTSAVSRLIASQLYQVSPYDPVAIIAAVALLFVIALVVCMLPAGRAARVDPIVAMRSE